MHTHQSLWKDGTNLFYDEKGYALLSDTARWYIGGLLKHAKAVLAFAAPTTNSYRRLVPGYEAPINLVYSQRNRSACIRIPTYFTTPGARRLEFRSPGPDVQPVPVVQCPAARRTRRRHQQDRATGPDRRATSTRSAPKRRPASTARRARSRKRSTRSRPTRSSCYRGDVFTKDVVDAWLDFKRAGAKEVQLRPHPYEFYLYSEM